MDTNQQLEAFFKDVERRAFRIAEIATRNRDDALDLVQEAMMKLAQRYADKPPAEWQPLFYRVLNSRIMDFHRRNQVRRRWRVWSRFTSEVDEDLIETAPDLRTADPSRQLQQDATMAALQDGLQTLSARQQQAFMLRVWEGMDVAQTAFAMGCSEGSVKTHYSRAVHALQALLEDHW